MIGERCCLVHLRSCNFTNQTAMTFIEKKKKKIQILYVALADVNNTKLSASPNIVVAYNDDKQIIE